MRWTTTDQMLSIFGQEIVVLHFGQKMKKSDVLPLMALLGFLEGTFSGPKILQTDPGEVTPHDPPGQPEKG